MPTVSWSVIKTNVNPNGTYIHWIKWIPPKESGFIVQKVEINDPCSLISGYSQPYFEAWRVENGEVTYEGTDDYGYDDSFSNCCDGEPWATEIALETANRQMTNSNIDYTFIAYNCFVYWVKDGSNAAKEIQYWEYGKDIGIVMAGNLKASYDEPDGLNNGRERVFKAEFYIAHD